MSDIKHTLFQRDSGRWVLAYVPPGGSWRKPKQSTAPKEVRSQVAAQAWCEATLREIRQSGGSLERRRPGEITLRECHERLMTVREAHPDTKRSTIENNKTHLKAQILAEAHAEANGRIADVPMADVDAALARKFVRAVRARCSPNHTRNIFSTMRVLWDVASAENLIRTPNPFRNELVVAELPKQRNTRTATDGQPITLPRVACQAILSADEDVIPVARRARTALAILGGFDDGELAGATWGAIGERDGVPFLAVRQALATRGRKGNATVETPKTENRLREVPLHPAAVEALNAWRQGWEQLVGRKPTPKDFVFVGVRGRGFPKEPYAYRPKSADLLRADLRALNGLEVRAKRKPLLADADVDLVTFKATRRTFSSLLKDADVAREDRGKLMGHSGESVTERNYTAHELRRLAGLVARIPLCWGAVQSAVRTADFPAQQPSSDGQDPQEFWDVPWSHLRDLNSRPTVYEVDDGLCTSGDDDEPPSRNDNESDVSSNGTGAGIGCGSDPESGGCTDDVGTDDVGGAHRSVLEPSVPEGAVAARFELPDGTSAEVDAVPGEPVANVTERLALGLRHAGVPALAKGGRLEVTPARRAKGGRS